MYSRLVDRAKELGIPLSAVVREAVVQTKDGVSFVEVETKPQTFARHDLKTGLSDGILVEVLSGVAATTFNLPSNFTLNGGTLEVSNNAVLALNNAIVAGGFPVTLGNGLITVNGGAVFSGTVRWTRVPESLRSSMVPPSSLVTRDTRTWPPCPIDISRAARFNVGPW